jgi:hypothetical protein
MWSAASIRNPMMKTLLLLNLALAAAPTVAQTPAPPPPVAVPPLSHDLRPPPPVMVPSPITVSAAIPLRSIAIVMTLGTETLWRGTLKVGGVVPARIPQSESADLGGACDTDPGIYGRQGRQIEMTVSAMQSPRAGIVYMLNARYSRPARDMPCNGGRSVSLDQRFTWDGKTSLRFEGDGGLAITLASP